MHRVPLTASITASFQGLLANCNRVSKEPEGVSVFTESDKVTSLGPYKGDEEARNRTTLLVIFRNSWSCVYRNSRVSLHWSFLHPISQQGTDFLSRLIPDFIAESLVSCYCPSKRFFNRVSSRSLAGKEESRSTYGRR